MPTEGFWISPGGDVLEIADHFEAMRDAPKAFGFSEREARGWKREDREGVLRKAIARGWIRVRGHRHYITFEMEEFTPETAFQVKNFLATSGAWPQEEVAIHELGPKKHWRETAGFFLEERHLALLGAESDSIAMNGIGRDLAAVVTDAVIMREQGFVPRGAPQVWSMGAQALKGIVRRRREIAGEPATVASLVLGLSAGFGAQESFQPDDVRTEAMKRFPSGGTLVVQLGWFDGTREDSIRLTLENAKLGEHGFRKEIERLARALVRTFRQKSVWVDFYRAGERLEAVSFDWKR